MAAIEIEHVQKGHWYPTGGSGTVSRVNCTDWRGTLWIRVMPNIKTADRRRARGPHFGSITLRLE